MTPENRKRLKRLIDLIVAKCGSTGVKFNELTDICASEKISRAWPTYLADIGVIEKRGNLRFFVNSQKYSYDRIIEELINRQRESLKESQRRTRAKNILSGNKRIAREQPLNFKKNKDDSNFQHTIKIDLEPVSESGKLFYDKIKEEPLSVDNFLEQIPIGALINFIKTKGYIVLKP